MWWKRVLFLFSLSLFFLESGASWGGMTEEGRLFQRDWVQTYRLCTIEFEGEPFIQTVSGPTGRVLSGAKGEIISEISCPEGSPLLSSSSLVPFSTCQDLVPSRAVLFNRTLCDNGDVLYLCQSMQRSLTTCASWTLEMLPVPLRNWILNVT